MQLFLKNTRGSITVFVTLIMIPTIFFTGFLTDLARIKLYSNQAIMAADNYGDAVLSEYDNLLKELYGLFAVTQNEKGLEELEKFQEYMKTSFNPAYNAVSVRYFDGLQNMDQNGAISYKNKKGFMPYANNVVNISYVPVENANLANSDVFATQVGDFMKFRIAQSIGDDGDILLQALDAVESTKDDANAIDKKTDLDSKAGETLEKAQAYYKEIKKINKYPDYILNINTEYQNAITTIEECENKANDEISELQNSEDAEVEASEENIQAIRDKYASEMENAYNAFVDTIEYGDITFATFPSTADTLSDCAQEVEDKMGELKEIRSELQSVLEQENISDTIKDGITDDLKQLDELFGGKTADFSADNYISLANYEVNQKEQNSDYELHCLAMKLCVEQMVNSYKDGGLAEGKYKEPLKTELWKDFNKNNSYYNLYESLKKCFDISDNEAVEIAKKKKNDANDKLANAEEKLKEKESTTARNIPSQFGFGKTGTEDNFSLLSMIKTAATYFKSNSLSDTKNRLINKVFMVEYDFGMFSSRVTAVDSDKGTKESLTGVPMSKDINYLYPAELEYIFGGYNDSIENLTASRNKILAFRAIVNYSSTYSINDINQTIRHISEAAGSINPILGITVSGALRLAVSGMETAADWEKLKQGNKVVLFKKELNDLTSYDSIKDLLDIQAGGDGPQNEFSLNYEQYLQIMILFLTTSDQVTSRTSNLITLNMNNVIQKDSFSELDFQMKKAVTAVNASCSVHSDFVVMPGNFAEKFLATDKKNELDAFEKNTYRFTVTRGY